MLNKIILVAVIALLIIALISFTGHKKDDQTYNNVAVAASSSYGSGQGAINVQVTDWSDSAWISSAAINATNIDSSLIKVGQILQRDPAQYSSTNQYQTWHESTCSAASLASVLNAFGHKVTIGDLIPMMQNLGGFSPTSGLSNYGVFNTIAQQYGLHATLDESKDLDSHFASIVSELQDHKMVIINVQDAVYFPNGHFIVAYGLNPDGTVAVMNSYPYPMNNGNTLQNWPLEGLKLYFSRTMRSIVFTN